METSRRSNWLAVLLLAVTLMLAFILGPSIHDKLEGFAVTGDGSAFAVTDNDGVDDSSGETQFLRLGRWSRLFR